MKLRLGGLRQFPEKYWQAWAAAAVQAAVVLVLLWLIDGDWAIGLLVGLLISIPSALLASNRIRNRRELEAIQDWEPPRNGRS